METEIEMVYEVVNGFSGMNRNVVVNLCRIIASKSGMNDGMKDWSIRMIIGMNQMHLPWRTHSSFISNRVQFVYIPVVFLSNQKYGYTTLTSPLRSLILFQIKYSTVFLEKINSEGVFQWTVRIHFKPGSRLYLGAAPSDKLLYFDSALLGFDGMGSGALEMFSSGSDAYLNFANTGFWTNTKTPNDAMVSVELDATAHILSFIVEKTKVPYAFSEVPTLVNLGMSGWGKPSFTSLSFRRLPVATPLAGGCVKYKWTV